jgi:Ca2+-binding RTX toxin-like protein
MTIKTGTAGADTLVGTADQDTLLGLGGNDQLTGGAGADLLDGGTGNDTARYGDSSEGVVVNLLFNVGSGGTATGDRYVSIENVTGSSFADLVLGDGGANVLKGGGGDDKLQGLGGNDVLAGGAGADSLVGDAGNDTADYSASKQGVQVFLGSAIGVSGDAEGDTYASIENATGSDFGDVLFGDGGANVLKGRGGDDVIVGDLGGDMLDGGDGIDTVDYGFSNAAVVVNLDLNVVDGGFAAGDSISHFENADGTNFNDVLTGSAGANRLIGFFGTDTILGLGGDDTIEGGPGADHLDGGTGIDTLDYSFSSVGVRFDLGTNFADAEGDTISGFENVIGSDFDDSFAGTDGANIVSGRGGDDAFFGKLGRDEFFGGAGADLFQFVTTADSGTTASTRDVIHDFHRSDGDRMQMDFFDANTGQPGEQTLNFIGQNGFTAAGQVRFFFEGNHTVVEVNTTDISGAEMQIQLDGQVTLAASDFIF